jgi:hypothetical protein
MPRGKLGGEMPAATFYSTPKGQVAHRQIGSRGQISERSDGIPAGSIKQIELDDYHLLRIVGVALDSAAESLAERRAEAIVQSWQLRDQQDQDLPAQSVVSMRLTMFIFGFGRIT